MLSLRRDDVTTTRTVVRITYFNPRLREGGDIICIVGNSCIVNFNPRLREGGDKIDILFPPNKRYFNPRLREGGDVLTGTARQI